MQQQQNNLAADQMYMDACKQLDREVLTIEDFARIPTEVRQAHYSLYRIATVIEAKKEGRKLDYDNNDQRKYSPWWDMETYGNAAPGSGFSLGVVDYVYAATGVGARLSSESERTALEIAETMIEDYRHWCKE